MVGKPNQTIPKAQLQPIPAFDEPFSRILIDCVGPLPRTICCYLQSQNLYNILLVSVLLN